MSWVGSITGREKFSYAPDGLTFSSSDFVNTIPEVIRASADAATYKAALAKIHGSEYSPIPQDPSEIQSGRTGRAFKIPVVLPEGLASGDGRLFNKGALGMRTFPLPLLWQIKTGDGHDGSVLVGRIDHVERTPYGLGNAYGVFDTGPYGQEAQRLVENGMLRWISGDLDKFEVDEERSDEATNKMVIKKGRLMGATLVPKPAFQECTIELVPMEDAQMPELAPVVASIGISEAIPVEPPLSWFEEPRLKGPTPITVNDDGRVFGHIATWDQSHIGLSGGTRPPRSASNYAYFHTGMLRTNEGKDIRVGQLTLAGGHAGLELSADAAVKHYDDTASAIADIQVGEDSYGIWCAGALRPGTTPTQVRALRASAPSGDWRVINHRHELVAICQVNVPGFPVPRAMVASGSSRPMALVAAGTETLIALRQQQLHDTEEAIAASARERLFKVLDVDGYMTEFKDFSPEKREELAKDGKALKDGSFPIENVADLRRAIYAYGRASEGKKAAVRRHIVKRARALGKTDMVPSDWKELSLNDETLSKRDKYEALVASARAKKVETLRARMESPAALAAKAEALRARISK